MEYRKYGKFKIADYYMSWIGIIILLIFAILCAVLKLSFLFILFPMVYAIIWLMTIVVPNRERFSVCNNLIKVKKGKKENEIIIPSKITLIVSYADICPPFAIRTSVGNQTHVLKDKYAITILREIKSEVVLERLHRNYVQIYTTSMIKNYFDECDYIYSFVCNQELLEEFLNNKECDLILPESLLDKVEINKSMIRVHIDKGH